MAIKTVRYIHSYYNDGEGSTLPEGAIVLDVKSYCDEDLSEDESINEVTYAETLAEACVVWGVEFHPAAPEVSQQAGA